MGIATCRPMGLGPNLLHNVSMQGIKGDVTELNIKEHIYFPTVLVNLLDPGDIIRNHRTWSALLCMGSQYIAADLSADLCWENGGLFCSHEVPTNADLFSMSWN